MSRFASLLALLVLSQTAVADPPKPVPADHAAKMANGTDLFKSHVREVLAKNCLRCHGGKKTQGGLDLATRGKLLKGGDSGPAVVPGDAKGSRLYQLAAHLKEPHMPDGGEKLPDADLKAIADWIDLGVPYDVPLAGKDDAALATTDKKQWAFQPIQNPPLPKVQNNDWVRDPIDRFILARLEAAGMKPAAAADRRTLIRRVTFDLTGLPPTPEEVAAFVNDKSPDAYAKLIDRLLASPAYGERWGRHWLDLVRYCDSFDARGIGSEGDCADAWRYRDWVVDALNRDLPYDRFIRMQIAGDLLKLPPEERVRGTIATGMLAIGNWGGGDADKEKLLTDIVDDQIDVVSRSILGLTVACARCHDHKFDPISTRDYYGLAGIFFSTHILPNVGPKTGGPPMLRIPVESVAETAKRTETEAKLKTLEKSLAETTAKARQVVLARLKADLPAHLLAAHDGKSGPGLDTRWLKLAGNLTQPTAGTVLTKSSTDLFGKKGLHGWRGVTDPPSFVVNATGAEAKFVTITMPAKTLAVHPGPRTDVAVVWTATESGDAEVSGSATDFDANCGDGFGWELRQVGHAGEKKLAGGVTNNGQKATFTASATVAAGDRLVLIIQRRAEYSCDTTGIEFRVRGNGKPSDLVADWLTATPPATAKLGPWSVEELSPAAPLPARVMEAATAWAMARKKATGGKLDRAGLETAARAYTEAIVATGGAPFLPTDATIAANFFEPKTREELARHHRELATLRATLSAPRPTANAAQEGGVPGSPHAGMHDVKVHVRGRYDRLGEQVPRGFPEVVRGANPPKITAGSGRTELADWLTSPKNPLTARVIVNRVWQYHVGEGIVRTPSNFGALGQPPTHPELLDHLARTFVSDGWSLRKLHRRILLSATYRQTSILDPQSSLLQADPDNRLWGRFSRRRLEAEAIRDSLLAVGGKLDPARGGPSVRDFASPRRTLYLTTIRSDRTGFGPLFDMADSTAPVDKRTVSTVAPQALFLMNHPFVKKQAEAFADRVMAKAKTDADRLDYAHRVAFGRPPTNEELALGQEMVKPGNREAWAAWCHLLMQANEFATVE